MTNPSPNDIDAVLAQVERQSKSPRELAREAVERHRAVKEPDYDFDTAPKELKAVLYGAALRYRKRSLWSRIFR